jgi:hypothetical protein
MAVGRQSNDPCGSATGALPARSAARRLPGAAVIALLAAGLGGCVGSFDQVMSSALVAPGKYSIYTCEYIERSIVTRKHRRDELEKLMAQSAQGPGGEFVNVFAYRTEYYQTRGELHELLKASDDKQCPAQSQWTSVRAVF